MANAKIQTTENSNSVLDFIQAVPEEQKRLDALELMSIIENQTGFTPKMWGPAIIGFGKYHYVYDSGREGDMPLVAFSPRKTGLVLYLSTKFTDRDNLLEKFGKHTTSKACIYVKKLADIKIDVLKKMIRSSVKQTLSESKAIEK